MTEKETFTDFMIGCMEGQDDISSAIVIRRKTNGVIGYSSFRQEVADTLGMLRFAQLSIEDDLKKAWSEDE